MEELAIQVASWKILFPSAASSVLSLFFLLIDITCSVWTIAGWPVGLFVRKVPTIQMTRPSLSKWSAYSFLSIQDLETDAEVSCKAQPSEIRRDGPSSGTVNLRPNVGQVSCRCCQCSDVGRGFNRSLRHEEERHPNQIQPKLNGIEGRALLSRASDQVQASDAVIDRLALVRATVSGLREAMPVFHALYAPYPIRA